MKGEERELGGRRSWLQLLQKQLTEVQVPQNGKLEQIKAALGYIRKKDFVALKCIYKRLFEKIIVRPLDEAKVQLEFVFNKTISSIRNGEGKCMEGQLSLRTCSELGSERYKKPHERSEWERENSNL